MKLKNYIHEKGYTYNSFDKHIGVKVGLTKELCATGAVDDETLNCYMLKLATRDCIVEVLNTQCKIDELLDKKPVVKSIPSKYSELIDEVILLCEIYK